VLRLAKLIGTKETLDLILSAEVLDADHSKRTGLLDEVVPEEYLLSIARKRAVELSSKEFKPRRFRFGGMTNVLIKENPVSRRMYFDAKKEIKSRELFAASRMAIEALEIGVELQQGTHAESVFRRLAVTDTGVNKIGLAIDEVRNDIGLEGRKQGRLPRNGAVEETQGRESPASPPGAESA
jgi:enoyl-CoA hydratase/carnithine racemase